MSKQTNDPFPQKRNAVFKAGSLHGPFVVLLEQNRADEPGDGSFVRPASARVRNWRPCTGPV